MGVTMSKELEQQIKTGKETIVELENQLKRKQSFFSMISPVDESDIQEELATQRIHLAMLYKNDHQFDEAIIQLKIAYDYYSKPKAKDHLDLYQITQKCIEILDLQIECSSVNKEQKKAFLAVILIKLTWTKYSKYKKNIPKYLGEYVALSPDNDGISKISYIIDNLDRSSFSDSNTYKYALALKANLLCDLSDFKSAYEAFSALIECYESLKKAKPYSSNYLSEEELINYLNTYSLSCLNGFLLNEKVCKVIENQYQKINPNYDALIESTKEQKDEGSLKKMALLYHHLKITPPKWFPRHSVQQLNVQSFSPEIPLIEITDNPGKGRLSRVKEEARTAVMKEIDAVPEHERIREKITLGWEQHGVGGYKLEIGELVERLFIPRALSPEQLKTMALKLPRGGILYGPPGTGKTLMARTIANYFFDEENVTVINGPALLSKFVGQSAENLRNILELARLKPHVTHVVIIDEIDALVCSRSSSEEGLSKQIKADLTTTLLTYLDGINVIDNLMILGLTNYFKRLDDALIRPGRLGLHINIGLPNLEDRLAILNLYLSDLQKKKMANDILNVALLAEKSEGLSGAAIKAFIDNAVEKFAVTQIVSFEQGKLKIGDTNKIVPLGDAQFLTCLENAFITNKPKRSEQERLLSRMFCQFNPSLYKKMLALREMVPTFAYLSPMIISVSGVLGTGSTTFAFKFISRIRR